MPLPLLLLGAVASGGLDLIGRGLQASDQKQAADAEAARLKRLAVLADMQARDAVLRGTKASGQVRMAGSKMIDQQQAAYAASGVDATIGSPAQLAGTTRMFSELDAQTTLANAYRDAWGFQQQASDLRRGSRQVQKAGEKQLLGNVLGAVGSLIQSSASVAGQMKGGGAAVSGSGSAPNYTDSWAAKYGYNSGSSPEADLKQANQAPRYSRSLY
jgi:fermentation-respiration switch protein FrsA (DUF1100 family)